MRTYRVLSLVLAAAGLVSAPARSDEGMWMLHQLPEIAAPMKGLGLELAPEAIWNPKTNSGLASAIPSLGGCSSSFVSPDGLIATNHHCAFGAIQLNSTPEHDYLRDGFVARERSQELPARITRVYVFKGYEDVTARFADAQDPSLSPAERHARIDARRKELVQQCEAEGLRCQVADVFGGAAYYLFRTLELRDVRLVCAPPGAVGNYGGEVDNWMWPRHTGDYSFFRAYVGPDGKPADYSPNNVPFHPDRYLKIATTPLREGDFTMIIGYPGRTFRYRTSDQVEGDTARGYPARIALLHDLIGILTEEGKRGREVEIKLASWLKGLENTYKNNLGMLEGLRKSDLAARKRSEEQALTAWIAADPERQARWGDVLPALAALQAEQEATRERDLLLAFLGPGRSATLLGAASAIERWTFEKGKPDLERKLGYQARDERSLRQRLAVMQKNLDLPTERSVLLYLFRRASQLPEGQRIRAVDALLAATGKSGEEAVVLAVDRLLGGCTLGEEARRLALFDATHEEVLASGDPMLQFAAALRVDIEAAEAADDARHGRAVTLLPRYIAALGAWRNKPLYPDANGTIRLTYGTVKGYSPRDAVVYKPFTTLAGVLEKHTGVEPFDAPERLRRAASERRGARFSDAALGDVPACFLSTNDITGGNSGSPIMNGRGELVGLAFDGNYESMTSDYQFSDEISRTINVDIRYVLWCLEQVDGAANLLRELGISTAEK
ncbi:MAG: S46 family peptidase [Thermoanaerobaculaceae bacterium]|nr:S46 family peptidase [Thermoanaerobaculaceae bacterium]